MAETDERRGFRLFRGSDERQRRFIPQRFGGNYGLLVVGLLVSYFLVAALSWTNGSGLVNRLIAVLFYGTLIVGFRGTTRKTERNIRYGLVVLVAFILNYIASIVDNQTLDQIQNLFRAFVVVLLMILILLDIVGEINVTVDTILGSVAAYILFALFWTSIYVTIELGNDGAFQIPNSSGSIFADLLYFSVVTQTTLGYGDIVPVYPVARQLASLQALIGQLYVAILVALLVGIAASQFMQRSADNADG